MEEIMNRNSCPECKKGLLVKKSGTFETVYTDKSMQTHPLSVEGISWAQCNACGEISLDHDAMTKIETARRRALGLLAPGDLSQLRVQLGRTQVEMSELLGIGEKTYCRWERGSYVQSEGFDRYIRLLLVEPENVHLLERIASSKRRPEGHSMIEEERSIFENLQDLEAVRERGRLFTERFIRGELQAA